MIYIYMIIYRDYRRGFLWTNLCLDLTQQIVLVTPNGLVSHLMVFRPRRACRKLSSALFGGHINLGETHLVLLKVMFFVLFWPHWKAFQMLCLVNFLGLLKQIQKRALSIICCFSFWHTNRNNMEQLSRISFYNILHVCKPRQIYF